MKNFDQILWVLSSSLIIPSDLIGSVYPSNYLKTKKIIIKDKHDVVEIINIYKPKIIVLGKCFNPNIINLAIEAKRNKIKIISIFDDWHFQPINTKQHILFNYNKKLAEISNRIVVKSIGAKNVIKNRLNIESEIIPDCIRYKTINPIDIFSNTPSLVWFGTASNFDTLELALKEISISKIKCNLSIVTKIDKYIHQLIDKKNSKYLKIKLVEFSDMNLINQIKQSNIIIIPLINDSRRQVKSSNRIVDALNFGRFVITSNLKIHRQFDNYCFNGNIVEGVDWAFNNQRKALSMINEGQKYVQDNFNIDKICFLWKQLFLKVDN